jgi:choline dehydrogenase
MYWPTGRGWGGTSSINGMAYIRGHRNDYDGWAAAGLSDWSYRHVLPYFCRAEANERGASVFHGDAGPLRVSDTPTWLPLSEAFLAAGKAAGFPFTEDFNGEQQEGFGKLQMTVHRGRRWSTATGYLRPALKRTNLTVCSHALVSRLIIERGRVTGVEWRRDGKIETATADREVVLCAGVTRTPQILMLSGIGDPATLRTHGIDVVCDSPQVGQNLQDHIDCVVQYECPVPVSLYSQTKPIAALRTGLEYILFRKGLAQGIGVEANAFLKSRADIANPDLQMSFVNALMEGMEINRHGFMAHVWHLRPEARGYVALRSGDPAEHPIVQPNYLTGKAEVDALRAGIKILRELIAQKPFDRYRGKEVSPGVDLDSDDAIDAFIRQTATGLFHPVGTARMGSDESSVVDEVLSVRGMQGIRVADASVMPAVVSGNTNAAVIMIAEKAADLMLGRAPLSPAILGN